MRLASIGKWLTLGGLVVLALSVTPTGEFSEAHEAWWSTRWQWLQRALRQDHAAPAATINPLLLYLGMFLSVGGLALAWQRDHGASTARAVQQRARPEAPTRRVFIGGLPFTTSRDELRQLFEAYGVVEHVHLMTDWETGRSRGFAFVTMADAHEARAAMAGLNGIALGGRTVTVSEAREREGPRLRQERRLRE